MIRCQAAFFTPGLQFRIPVVLGFLLSRYSDVFDGETMTVPKLDEIPANIPQIILKSADGKQTLQVAPSRLDIIREEDPISETDLRTS